MTSASSSSKAPAFVPRLALAQNLSVAANTPQPYSGVVSSPRTQTFQQHHHVVTASSPNLGYSGILRRSESPRCAIPAGHGAAERIRKLQTLWDDLTNALDRELLGNGHKADRNRPYSVQMRREIKDARVPSAFGRQGKMVVKPELVPRMPLSARGSNGVNRATTVTSSPHKSNVVSASPRRASSARTASTPRPASTSRPSPRNSARSSLSARQSTTPRDSAPNPTAIWTRGVSAGALAEDPRLRHLSPRFTPRPSPRPWKQPVVQPRPPPAGGEEIPHGVGHDYPANPSRTMNFVLSQRVLSHGDTKRRWRAWHPSLMKTDNLTNAEHAAYTHATSGLHQYESLYWAKHSKLDVDKAIADRYRILKERGEQNVPKLSSTIDDFEDDMTVYEKTDRLRYYVSGVGALLRTANNA